MSLHKQLQDKKREFKSEYLFRTCSVATDLVTSLEFIQPAVQLCWVVLAKNGTVWQPFIHSSKQHCDDYVAVPDRFGQNEEPASKNEERIRKKSSSIPERIIKQRTVKPCLFSTCNQVFLDFFLVLLMNLFTNLFSLSNTLRYLILYFYQFLFCRREIKHFDVHF